MGFQSKTYSLSDEVVAAIDGARARGETPNRFLRRVLGIDPPRETALNPGEPVFDPQNVRKVQKRRGSQGDQK